MKKSNFIKFESTYKKGTYADYSSQKEMDLYVRGRDKDGENDVIKVVKTTLGVARIVNFGHIAPVNKDNLIKDLCYGLLINEDARRLFIATQGTNVDLESFSIGQLKVLVKKYSHFGARDEDPNAKKSNTVKIKEEGSNYLFRENEGEIVVNLMPTRAGIQHKAKTSYEVTEVTPSGEVVVKHMTKEDFEALGKIAKSSSWTSNRFAANSPYVQLAEMGIIKNNNGPAETCIFKMKLKNILSVKDVVDSSCDE